MTGKAKTIERYKGAIDEYIKELERYAKRAGKSGPNLKIVTAKTGNDARKGGDAFLKPVETTSLFFG